MSWSLGVSFQKVEVRVPGSQEQGARFSPEAPRNALPPSPPPPAVPISPFLPERPSAILSRGPQESCRCSHTRANVQHVHAGTRGAIHVQAPRWHVLLCSEEQAFVTRELAQ